VQAGGLAFADDALRTGFLARMVIGEATGPRPSTAAGWFSRVPAVPIAPGYTVRPVGTAWSCWNAATPRAWVSTRGTIKIAVENRERPAWYRNIQNAPLYRRDLDLVAVAPDGAIAAFCTAWFDDVTRSGVFEPVATRAATSGAAWPGRC